MEEDKYYDLVRRVDQVNTKQDMFEKTLDNIIERQDKHETKFENVVEKLADSVANIDKKLDMFVARTSGSKGAWESILKYAPTIVFTIISGVFAYTQYINTTISEAKHTMEQTKH
jgi:mRNA-degrading endonuclease YafQ of YafQ-DinJ toxin-antitoxin module